MRHIVLAAALLAGCGAGESGTTTPSAPSSPSTPSSPSSPSSDPPPADSGVAPVVDAQGDRDAATRDTGIDVAVEHDAAADTVDSAPACGDPPPITPEGWKRLGNKTLSIAVPNETDTVPPSDDPTHYWGSVPKENVNLIVKNTPEKTFAEAEAAIRAENDALRTNPDGTRPCTLVFMRTSLACHEVLRVVAHCDYQRGYPDGTILHRPGYGDMYRIMDGTQQLAFGCQVQYPVAGDAELCDTFAHTFELKK